MNPRARLLVALVSTGLVAYIALGSLLGRVMGDTMMEPAGMQRTRARTGADAA